MSRAMASIVQDYQNNKVKAPAAAHVLAIPLGSQGHITPLLRLTTQLARTGITITFVSYQDAIAQLTSAKDGSNSELQSLDFRFVGLPIPAKVIQGQRKSSTFFSRAAREAFKPLQEQLIHDKSTGIGGPTSIISDMFLPWTQELADTLEIPRYMFVTSGVIFARAMQGFLEYYASGQLQFSDKDDGKLVYFDSQLCIPGLPSLRYYELPRSFREDPGEVLWRGESVTQAAGLLVNSFLELEGKVIDTWRNTVDHIKVPKIYPVGPFLSTSVALPNVKVNRGLEDSASKCLQFLDSQAPTSVLYVAFGSHANLRPAQTKELALGLEESEQHFLWVVPQSEGSSGEQTPPLSEVLPIGFEARLGERCCIVTGWAPQLQVLAHSSTGGFLTHSGWNSTLESIVLGVPMIACPQSAEQHLNCRYVVDELHIAAELPTGPQNVFKRDEVNRVVRLLMVESEGKAIRSRMEALQRTATAAAAEGGSMSRVFQELLDDFRNHNLSPNHGSKLNLSPLDQKAPPNKARKGQTGWKVSAM